MDARHAGVDAIFVAGDVGGTPPASAACVERRCKLKIDQADSAKSVV